MAQRSSGRQDCGALGIGAPELQVELIANGQKHSIFIPSFFTVAQAKTAIWNSISDLPPITHTCLAVSSATRLTNENVKLKKAHASIEQAFRAGHVVRLILVTTGASPTSPRVAAPVPVAPAPKELARNTSWRTGSKPTPAPALAPVASPPPSPSATRPSHSSSPPPPSPRLAAVRPSARATPAPASAPTPVGAGARSMSEEEWRKYHAAVPMPGYFIDEGMELPMDAFGAANVAIEEPQCDIPYYYEHFYGREHANFVGTHESVGPIVLSLSERADNGSYRAMIWTKSGDERLFLSESDVRAKADAKAMLKQLKKMQSSIADVKLAQVRDADLQRRLAEMELRQIVNNYKIGVLYAKEGQSVEEDMFQNRETSPEFEEFLALLGERVPLRGWQEYRGGLDVKNDLTGTHSVYSKWHDYEVMFHVSTLLPYFPHDKQQLERKRHIGNDIVVIVFMDGATPYSPTTISSSFNHVFFIVNPLRVGAQLKYKLTIAAKDGVRRWKPLMPTPAIFDHSPAFREFLLTKRASHTIKALSLVLSHDPLPCSTQR